MIERVEGRGVVVLVGPDASEVGEAVRAATAAGERVAAVIGAPDDPSTRAVIAEMVDELSGGPEPEAIS